MRRRAIGPFCPFVRPCQSSARISFMTKPLLAVGWDVGGWHGTSRAVAVAVLDAAPPSPAMWRGTSKAFGLESLDALSLEQLIQRAWHAFSGRLRDFEVVVAVDAPFGFPESFRRLLNRKRVQLPQPANEMIDNSLAYRFCDQ